MTSCLMQCSANLSLLLAYRRTVVLLHPLQSAVVQGTGWVDPYVQDFRARFMIFLATFMQCKETIAICLQVNTQL